VGAGIDVRIDPQSARRAQPPAFGNCRELDRLFLGLDVELADADLKAPSELRMRLAHSGKDDLVRRHSGSERARQLSSGDHVGAEALPLQHPDDGDVRVRLQ